MLDFPKPKQTRSSKNRKKHESAKARAGLAKKLLQDPLVSEAARKLLMKKPR